jgi:DASS family divalent anion:Na+ symporter
VIAIAMLVILIMGGCLDRERFRSAIDWGFLIFFGVLLSTGNVLRTVGVDRWLGDRLMRVAEVVGRPEALLVLLALFVVVARLVLPSIPGRFLLMLALVPPAAQMGLSPWLVGFVILTAAMTWLHPNLSDYCRLIREATGDDLFNERQGVWMGVAMTVVTLLAVVVSIPYWRALGLIGHP